MSYFAISAASSAASASCSSLENGIAQLGDARFRQRMHGELLELVDDVGGGCEVGVAAARGVGAALEALAVLEMDRHAHRVAELGAARGDGRIGVDVHALGQGDAARVVHAGLVELIDEAVAFQEEGGDAEGQVELRRGEALRLVFPADVVGGDLRAVHVDSIHIT